MKQVTTLLAAILIITSSAFASNTIPATTAPVKYVSFTATNTEKFVLLSWVTVEENNTESHFEAERSFNGKDFTLAAVVLDGFEDGSQKTYQFKDKSADMKGKTVVYYRLKHIDAKGGFTYSNYVTVSLNTTADATEVKF